MSPGRFYIDKTKKKNTYTKISTVIKIYGDIDKAENSQKKTIFFSMSPRRFYIDKTKKEHIHENQYNNKNIWGYRKSKKQPEKDTTLYQYMWISKKQKTARK